MLSLVSRYSFFRISFDKGACTHCGNCEHTCKAEAIDAKNLTVDTSRCVDCFNCVSSCSKGGLQYRFNPPFRKEEKAITEVAMKMEQQPAVNSRRTFLATGATVAATLPIVSAIAEGVEQCEGHGNGNGHGKRKGRKNGRPSPLPDH